MTETPAGSEHEIHQLIADLLETLTNSSMYTGEKSFKPGARALVDAMDYYLEMTKAKPNSFAEAASSHLFSQSLTVAAEASGTDAHNSNGQKPLDLRYAIQRLQALNEYYGGTELLKPQLPE